MMSIVKSEVTDKNERTQFLPKHLPSCFSIFESSVYHWLDRYAKNYHGGYYHFYTLGNGGFFIAPDQGYYLDEFQNGFGGGDACAEACGVIACLYVLNSLSFHFHEKDDEAQLKLVIDYYYQLRDYAISHEESGIILQAID
jgi:hypothetical protein